MKTPLVLVSLLLCLGACKSLADQELDATRDASTTFEDASIDAASVLAHCRRYLSAHKCPRAVRVVDTLPRTASGKVKRLAARQMLEAHG